MNQRRFPSPRGSAEKGIGGRFQRQIRLIRRKFPESKPPRRTEPWRGGFEGIQGYLVELIRVTVSVTPSTVAENLATARYLQSVFPV